MEPENLHLNGRQKLRQEKNFDSPYLVGQGKGKVQNCFRQ
uniref:Uncharacterized protein n=1 Tax=Rhizophora mucronata TaxID=61149 RepID=A0A2P2MYA8_RHIMU